MKVTTITLDEFNKMATARSIEELGKAYMEKKRYIVNASKRYGVAYNMDYVPMENEPIIFWDCLGNEFKGVYKGGLFIDKDGPVGAVVTYCYVRQ